MTLQNDHYAKITDVIDALLLERQSNPNMKLAFCFMGGGAKGVYQAGVIEAIAQHLAPHGGLAALRPDIIAGTSIGSINAFTLWTELMYPGGAMAPFQLRQSSLWQAMGNGGNLAVGHVAPNKAAEALLDPGLLVDFVTDQTALPVIAPIMAAISDFQSRLATVTTDFASLRSNLHTITSALPTIVDALSPLVHGRPHVPDPVTALHDVEQVVTAATALEGNVMDILDNGAQDVLEGTALILDVTSQLIPALVLLTDFLKKWLANGKLAMQLMNNGGIRAEISAFLKTSPGNVAQHGEQAVRNDWLARANAAASNHTAPPPELYMTGTNIENSRLMVYAMAAPANMQAVADDATWVVDLPGAIRANLPDSVFYAMPSMPMPLIDAVMSSAALPVAFNPVPWSITRDSDILTNPRKPGVISWNHTAVDGGVMDNCPIDIARRAGATHIVSFELGPLCGYNSPLHMGSIPIATPGNFAMVGYSSFDTLMRRVWAREIVDIMEANQAAMGAGKPVVPVYRIGPVPQAFNIVVGHTHNPQVGTKPIVQNGVIVPQWDTFNFNGLWSPDHVLMLSMEDRFMQGYQDVMLLVPPNSAPGLLDQNNLPPGFTKNVSPNLQGTAMNDPVFASYFSRATASGNNAPTGRVSYAVANMAWTAVTKDSPPAPLAQ